MFQWEQLPLVGNQLTFRYNYEISVYSGLRRGAGTYSRVFFVLGGELSSTPERELDDGERNVSKMCIFVFLVNCLIHFYSRYSSEPMLITFFCKPNTI